jgi:serine/threonine protein kinase
LEKRAATLSQRDRLQLSLGAAMGVDQLHGEGVLHRDIAARNFLVDANNTVKLAGNDRHTVCFVARPHLC